MEKFKAVRLENKTLVEGFFFVFEFVGGAMNRERMWTWRSHGVDVCREHQIWTRPSFSATPVEDQCASCLFLYVE